MTDEQAGPGPGSEPDELARLVIRVIAETQELPEEGLTLDSRFDDLGFDSLDGINIAFALEEELDIEIPDEAVRSIESVGEIVEKIRPLVERRG